MSDGPSNSILSQQNWREAGGVHGSRMQRNSPRVRPYLIICGPRHNGLMGQNILAVDRRHTFNSAEWFSTCQRLRSWRWSRLPLAGAGVTGVKSSGSQERTTYTSDLLWHASIINPNRCATAGSFSASSTRFSSRERNSGRSGRIVSAARSIPPMLVA